jgi:hypothetical protein
MNSLYERMGGQEGILAFIKPFYADVRQHAELGPVFNQQITDWPAHLDRIAGFWARRRICGRASSPGNPARTGEPVARIMGIQLHSPAPRTGANRDAGTRPAARVQSAANSRGTAWIDAGLVRGDEPNRGRVLKRDVAVTHPA